MDDFDDATREDIRYIFQPSKILLAIVRDERRDSFNILPLCFHMWSSYSPLMYAVAVHDENYSAGLFRTASEFTLSLPGEAMVRTVLYCGTRSGRSCNKIADCQIALVEGSAIATPGIANALANMELRIVDRVPSGDHTLVLGEVVSMKIAHNVTERPLLSIGPLRSGFEVLATEGIHTIAVWR